MKYFRKNVLFLLFMMIIGFAMISNHAIAQEKSEAELSGQVVDAATQESVAGADIALHGEGKETTTDEDGSFSFEELEPGTYTVSATAEGYEDWEQEVEVTDQGGSIQIELEPMGDKL